MQQSKEDVALTQKVGKTRIVIEQANGQMKKSTGFFDKNIRIDQIGLADLIFRASYLVTNFRLPFIQGRDEIVDEDDDGRPCKAELRWGGATDDGLIDVLPMIDLWGIDQEVNHWNNLRAMPEHENLSDTEISDMVLDYTGHQSNGLDNLSESNLMTCDTFQHDCCSLLKLFLSCYVALL